MGEALQALTKAAPVSSTKKGKRLTQTEVGLLLKLHAEGLTQEAIAQRLGVTQGAVWKWIQNTTDSTDLAKSYLRGSALRMAENIVKKGRAVDHVAALKGLSVLAEERSAGLTIQIGIKDSDVTLNVGETLSAIANPQRPSPALSVDTHSLSVDEGGANVNITSLITPSQDRAE